MNYARIYAAFIDDRKAKQPSKPTYFEKHHIVPRSLGGGDERSNIVRLTARDHYFAHCCLAKMHGGKMWSALFALANMAKVDATANCFLKARMVDVARKKAAVVRSENMTALWASGEFSRQRTYAPISDYHRRRLTETLTGRKKSAESLVKQSATHRRSAKEFVFRQSETGEVFRGTQREFSERTGVSQSLASCLTRGKILSAKLWTLDGAPTERMFGRDPIVRRFLHTDGRVFMGTTYDFRTTYNLDSGVISNLINGKNRVKSFKGWTCEGAGAA